MSGFWITVALMGIGAVALMLAFIGGVEHEPIEHEVDEP